MGKINVFKSMKSGRLLLLMLLSCGVAGAQVDTVRIGAPWYLFNDYKALEFRNCCLGRVSYVGNLLAHYALPDSNTVVYGIYLLKHVTPQAIVIRRLLKE